jgi:hypothetical protein
LEESTIRPALSDISQSMFQNALIVKSNELCKEGLSLQSIQLLDGQQPIDAQLLQLLASYEILSTSDTVSEALIFIARFVELISTIGIPSVFVLVCVYFLFVFLRFFFFLFFFLWLISCQNIYIRFDILQ